MARLLTKMVLLAFIIHIVLYFAGYMDLPGSSLFNLMIDPSSWGLGTGSIVGYLEGLFLLGSGAAVLVGTLFRNDLLTFAGLSGILLSFAQSFYELFNVVKDSLGFEMALLIVSPLIAIYIFAIVAFWRGLET